MSVASVSTVDSGLTNLIHDRCSLDVEWLCLSGLQEPSVCSLFTLSSAHAWLEWMCPLKRDEARRERESGLRVVNSLETLLRR